MHAAITYRRVKKKDILEIINLFKTIFKKNISVEFYNWRYLTKNFYNSFVAIKNGEHNGIGYLASNFQLSLNSKIKLTEVKNIILESLKK